ncbi:ATP synthase subunit s, mitochondrial-like [Lineus longissimus]|uniref:ATP synthase subunit s, mitochondrial-like n=1 Tax=Lineus longissimus TaxID=88925 RepID=UPI00315CA969
MRKIGGLLRFLVLPAELRLTCKLLRSNYSPTYQRRYLWHWLNSVFNRIDHERVKEVGPDRACAEWLLRCGAHVRWCDAEKFETDYNRLPLGNYRKYKIEEVNADEAAIMGLGFEHFNNVKHLKKMRFHFCSYLEDDAMQELTRLKDSLEHLVIGSCGDITDRGLGALCNLHLLKSLTLYNLPEVKDKKGCIDLLQKSLPQCTIEFVELPTKLDKPEKT